MTDPSFLDQLGRWEPVLYLAAVGLLLLRQFVSWFMGWWYHGRFTTHDYEPVWGRTPLRPWFNVVRCEQHQPGRDPQESPNVALKPVAAGARKWTYQPRLSSHRQGWIRWLARCLVLASHRRFEEPDFGRCVFCEATLNSHLDSNWQFLDRLEHDL